MLELQSYPNFRDLLEHLIVKGVDLNFFANVVWTIWHHRNALRTSDKPFPIHRVLLDARSVQASFVRPIPPKPSDQVRHVPHHTGWSPPDNHMLKVNFDGATFREDQKVGVGVIIKDELGRVIAFEEDKI